MTEIKSFGVQRQVLWFPPSSLSLPDGRDDQGAGPQRVEPGPATPDIPWNS
jgi:hypothetical protein